MAKRKGSDIDDEEEEEEERTVQRPALKKSKSSVIMDASSSSSTVKKQYTNMTIPVTVSLPEATPGTVKICSWNVAGFRAAQKKGFKYYIEAEKPDILILTETKMSEIPVDPFLDPLYPHRYWNIASKKGYAGTAIFSKRKPLSATYLLPTIATPDLVTGRLVILEFESLFLVGTYVPNAGQKLKTLEAKETWQEAFGAHLRDLDAQKPVIWAGDLNVAPTAKDLKNPKPNWNKTAGYTASETQWFANFLKGEEEEGKDTKKFVEVWRKRHPNEEAYTYFSMMRKCREKGIGWRLDMFVLSERLCDRVKTCEIREEIYGASDHLPIVLEIEGDL